MPQRQHRRLRPIRHVQLDEDGADVVLHRPLGQMQTSGDLGVVEAIGQQTKHFQLPLTEVGADGAAGLRAGPRLSQLFEQLARHTGIHVGSTRDRTTNRCDQTLHAACP